jgi:hypothetical protein
LRADESSKGGEGHRYRVPPELAHLILQFDGSILVDRTWGEVAGRRAAAAANLLGRHMVHELLTGNPSMEEPGTSEQTTVACLGRDAPYAERLLFEVPQGGTEDLAGSTLAGAVLQQLAGRRKDAVTGGEEATDRRTPGCRTACRLGSQPRRGIPTSPAWLRFRCPRLVSASSLKGADLG